MEPVASHVAVAVAAGLIVSLATHGWALATRRYARLLTHERLRVHAGVRLVWSEPLVRCAAAVAIALASGFGFKALGMPVPEGAAAFLLLVLFPVALRDVFSGLLDRLDDA